MSVTDRDRGHLSIGEVLALLQGEFPDVTISKIRFLESQGLIDPERTPSGYRKFYDADISRLRSILTLQRDHFLPLRVIKERIEASPELLDAPTTGGPVRSPGESPTAAEGHSSTVTPLGRDLAPRPLVLSRPDRGTAADPVDPHEIPSETNGTEESGRVFPWMQRIGASRTADRTDGPLSAAGGADAAPDAAPDTAVDPTATAATGASAETDEVAALSPVDASTAASVSSTSAAPEGSAGAPQPADSAATSETTAMSETTDETAGDTAEGTSSNAPDGGTAGTDGRSSTGRRTVAGGSGRSGSTTGAARPVGGHTEADPARPEGGHEQADRPSAPPPTGVRAITGDVSSALMTTDELAAATGLSAEQLSELERFGLITGTQTGPVRFFDDDALVVARLASRLGAFGIEPRHLRMYKVAADREVALYDQVVSPLAHHRDRGERAAEVMAQLADLGEAMRRALVQRATREQRRP